MCICRLTLAWISYNPRGVLPYPDLSSLTATGPSLMPTGHFCCPVSTGHSRHPLPTAFREYLCPTPICVPFLLPVASRSRAQAFVWFRAKTDKGIVCLADHLHSVTPVFPAERNIDEKMEISEGRYGRRAERLSTNGGTLKISGGSIEFSP